MRLISGNWHSLAEKPAGKFPDVTQDEVFTANLTLLKSMARGGHLSSIIA
jgi:hypothetical protein